MQPDLRRAQPHESKPDKETMGWAPWGDGVQLGLCSPLARLFPGLS